MNAKRKGDWIQTYTGKLFWPFDPRPTEIDIIDIAHALSNLCRFGGHCNTFYSVAEHSVRASHLVSDDVALWALLHDAPEAYLGDVVRPIKHQARFLKFYGPIEQAVMLAIAAKFGLGWPEPAEVAWADDVMLRTEQRDLMSSPPRDWVRKAGIEPLAEIIVPATPRVAKENFLQRFYSLTRGGR